MSTRSRAPAGLGPRGKRLWRAALDEHADYFDGQEDDPPDLGIARRELLLEACRVADVLDRIGETLAGEGSQGQSRPHPLLKEWPTYLQQLSTLLDKIQQ